MTDPTPTTLRVWEALPEAYRDADEVQTPTPYPLRRYLGLTVDVLDDVATLLDRIDYRAPDEGGDGTDTSDLVDPTRADPAWLAWLGQFVNATNLGGLTEAQRREAIGGASTGWRAGTMPGLYSAVRSHLTPNVYGTGYVAVIRDPADPNHLTIVTVPGETPQGGDALLAQVVADGAKPAGVYLTWAAYAPSWDVVEQVMPSWDAIEAHNPWDTIEAAYPA